MELDLTGIIYALSFALDAVEHEVTGATAEHGKRVAALCYMLGRETGMDRDMLREFIGCAMLHDNALAEYLREEYPNADILSDELFSQIRARDAGESEEDGRRRLTKHCSIGERRVCQLPFRTDVSNIILWHHENADGSGAFGLTEKETSFRSEILRLADRIDILFDLTNVTPEQFEQICNYIRKQEGVLFSHRVCELFLEVMSYETLQVLKTTEVEEYLRRELTPKAEKYDALEMKKIAAFFAAIIDYKSSFTKKHSFGVAEKAERMAKYYGWSEEKTLRYFFAGAMHDLGKLVISNDILEKPDRLNSQEFSEIKNHAAITYFLLKRIPNLEDVTEWASNHHEKLDGSGYPRGLVASDLSKEDRLMACLDIYQALTEKRPYKDGMTHKEAMQILRSMAQKGQLDAQITEDMEQFGA